MTNIFIATGGTGGHIIPARCLAKELAKNYRVFILADKKYQPYIKAEDDFYAKIIPSAQLKKSFAGLLFGGFKIFFGTLKSLFLFLKYRPKYVFAFGGYATFPILIAAILTRTKIILHEQNAHFGKVNRIFAKFCDKIALTFAKTDAILQKYQEKCTTTGNPVREEILELNKIDYKFPEKQEAKKRDKMGYEGLILASEFNDLEDFEKNKKYFKILIIGGSGGAKIFSEILPKAFFNLPEDVKNYLYIFQQCRSDLIQSTYEQYKKFNMNIEIDDFFEDMREKISNANLIIARSGSSSLAEFAAAKKPMILVPFAKSADNHQLKNAKIFEENGLALVIEEKDFTINNIAKTLTNLLQNKEILLKMSKNCEKIANLDATKNLANLIR